MLASNTQIKTVLKSNVDELMVIPRTAVDVYKLGLALNNLVYDCLQPLESRPIDQDAKQVLVLLAIYREKEENLLRSCLNYELNLQLQHFYDSRGNVIEGDFINDKRIETIGKLVHKNINEIKIRMRLVKELIARKDKNLSTTFVAWLDLRNSCSRFYRALFRFYPEGSISNALSEMADILEKHHDSIIESRNFF